MENFETINQDQLEEFCNKVGCKYVQLEDLQGKKIVGVQSGSTTLKEKFNEINTYLKNNPKENFFIVKFTKSKKGKNYKEFKYYLTNTTGNQSMSAAPTYNYNMPFDADRITKQNLNDGNTIAQLSADLKLSNIQLDEAKNKIDELESEISEMNNANALSLKEDKPNAILGFAKDVLPQFMPLAEKYFELAEKKLSLQAMALQMGHIPVVKKQHPFRPLPNANDEVKVNEYCSWMDNLPDEIFEKEMTFCNSSNPELCRIVTEKLYDSDTKKNENEI